MSKAIAVWLAVVALLLTLSFAGGCSLDELITVDVPDEVREATGSPDQVTLREAPYTLAEYDRVYEQRAENLQAEYESGREQFAAEIGDGELVRELLAGAINDGINLGVPALGNVPGGAILASLLAGVGGYVTRRAGDAKRQAQAEAEAAERIRAEADKAWDEAVRETRENLLTTLPGDGAA